MRVWRLQHSRQRRSLANQPLRKGQIEKLAAGFIDKVFLAECDEDWMTGKIYLNLKD